MNVPIKHFQVYYTILQYIQVLNNHSDLQKWNPKFKNVILQGYNTNIEISKSSLNEFYQNQLKEQKIENNERQGFFSIKLPLKRDQSANEDHVLRFKITFQIKGQNLTIGVSDFFNDYNLDMNQENLQIIQDQILYTLAYTFGSEQAFKQLLSETQN